MLWSFISSEFGGLITFLLAVVMIIALFASANDPLDHFKKWPPGLM